ncbi:MAG: 5-formyltetrahydrofolate cyclo-ligase [Clostridiales bacterium]|nr:5-formyltetrahydrofolate cyclo-ligase [Clostridiales bacterium]
MYADKNETRKICRENRKKMTSDDVREKSSRICKHLMNLPKLRQASQVLVYSAIHKEVDLTQLIKYLWEAGKSLAFPKVIMPGNGLQADCSYPNPGITNPAADSMQLQCGNDMEFYEVSDLGQLSSGAFGILEPKEGLVPVIPHEDAVICVPGVAFSSDGCRIGMGRGYYDRYLSRYPYLYKIGVAYELQMGYNWEADALDVPMDIIVTEETYRCV